MILHGLRAIGRYTGVAGMTVLRWHIAFRGRKEPGLLFPLMIRPSGKGWGYLYSTDTALIEEWIRRWAEIDAKAAQVTPGRLRKSLRMAVTVDHPATKQTTIKSHERRPEQPALPVAGKVHKQCTCGTPMPCTAH